MKVVIADLFSQAAIEELTSAGLEVVYNPDLNGNSLKAELETSSAQVLVVRSTKVTADIISGAKGLEFIIRAGAGVDNIDIPAATNQAIYVANCPGKNSVAVAELVMGHILSVDRRLPENYALLKQGKWNKGAFAECTGLKGRKLGIIGLGAIGREVAVRARSFGLDICGTDPFVSESQAKALGIEYFNTAEEVARVSDIITFHVPATEQTRGMINSAFVANCKEQVTIVNTSRGDLVNDTELVNELNARPGLWYACDVYRGEPSVKEGDFATDLSRHPKVYGSHHIGASTKQAENAIGQEALRMILQYAKTFTVDQANLVNLKGANKAKYHLVVRHNGAGLLSEVLQQLQCCASVVDISDKLIAGEVFTLSVSFNASDHQCILDIAQSLKNQSDRVLSVSLTFA